MLLNRKQGADLYGYKSLTNLGLVIGRVQPIFELSLGGIDCVPWFHQREEVIILRAILAGLPPDNAPIISPSALNKGDPEEPLAV